MLLVSVLVGLTNAHTGRHELLAGHLACVFCEVPHFGRHAKEIVFKFMFNILFSWVSCPLTLIQSRTLLLTLFSQFMVFILPARIRSAIIYYLSEGQ